MIHDQGAAYKDCGECDGHGYFETVIGERQPGLGGIEPIIRTTKCEACDGDGFVEREREEMAEEIERLDEMLRQAETARQAYKVQRDTLIKAVVLALTQLTEWEEGSNTEFELENSKCVSTTLHATLEEEQCTP